MAGNTLIQDGHELSREKTHSDHRDPVIVFEGSSCEAMRIKADLESAGIEVFLNEQLGGGLDPFSKAQILAPVELKREIMQIMDRLAIEPISPDACDWQEPADTRKDEYDIPGNSDVPRTSLRYPLPITIDIRNRLIFSLFGLFIFYALTFMVFSSDISETGIADLKIYKIVKENYIYISLFPFGMGTLMYFMFEENFIYRFIFQKEKIIFIGLMGKRTILKKNIILIARKILASGDVFIDIHYRNKAGNRTKILSISKKIWERDFEAFYETLRENFQP